MDPGRRLPLLNTRLNTPVPLRIQLLGNVLRRLSVLLGRSRIAHSKAMTPFCTTAFKYFASVSSLHSGAETMLVGTFATTWLVCTFHCLNPDFGCLLRKNDCEIPVGRTAAYNSPMAV